MKRHRLTDPGMDTKGFVFAVLNHIIYIYMYVYLFSLLLLYHRWAHTFLVPEIFLCKYWTSIPPKTSCSPPVLDYACHGRVLPSYNLSHHHRRKTFINLPNVHVLFLFPIASGILFFDATAVLYNLLNSYLMESPISTLYMKPCGYT